MCGIIGAISERDISKVLLEGLRRLEYRGYDSAGIALINHAKRLQRIRIQGKVQALADAMEETAIAGNIGIAHTRWATHGKPCEQNAHPHMSHGEIAVVHNGIIENHEALRLKLQSLGYEFTSETDTEVAAHLIYYHFQAHKNLLQAVQTAASEMSGAFALGVIHEHCNELVALRKGSPLVVGEGIGEKFIASDALALKAFAQTVYYLEDGDSAILQNDEIRLFNRERKPVTREAHHLDSENFSVHKGPYRHFMLKEIHEQGKVLADTLEGRIASLDILRLSFGERIAAVFPQVKCIHIAACGTSYHAGLIAKYWIESLTTIPVSVEFASEYRYRPTVILPDMLFVSISQSGETADTLAALEKAKQSGYLATLCICNAPNSSLVRESDGAFLTRAGVEIGVASTKAFTTQLAALLMLTCALGNADKTDEILTQLQELPMICEKLLQLDSEISKIANSFVSKAHALFIGRGVFYPVALEGALKLKEISYIHAEAYPGGELKHGPLALVDKNMPVVAIVPHDALIEKIKSNLQEISARGGELVIFSDAPVELNGKDPANFMKVPSCGAWIAPIVYTIPLQLLAYYVAIAKGTDVDQPRNLAKSVTVE